MVAGFAGSGSVVLTTLALFDAGSRSFVLLKTDAKLVMTIWLPGTMVIDTFAEASGASEPRLKYSVEGGAEEETPDVAFMKVDPGGNVCLSTTP